MTRMGAVGPGTERARELLGEPLNPCVPVPVPVIIAYTVGAVAEFAFAAKLSTKL